MSKEGGVQIDSFEDGEYFESVEEAEAYSTPGEAADHDDWDEVITEIPDEDEGSGEKGGQKEDPEEEISTDSQVNNLEEKEAGETDKEEKDDKGDEGDKPEDEESDDPEDAASDTEEDASFDAGKMVKAFAGDQSLEIPQNATFRQKVAGKNEIVTLQELQDNYSGKQHYDKKFSELADEKSAHQAKSEQFETELDNISTILNTTRQGIEKGLSGDGDIRDAVNNLIDLMDIDVYDFHKALFESTATDVYKLAQMDEGGQRAYWAERKNDHLVKKQENLNKAMTDRQAQQESEKSLASLRQTHSLTEDQYSQGVSELKSLGNDKASPEQVVKYLHMKPFAMTAQDLLTPYFERLSDDQISEGITDIMNSLEQGEFTKEEFEEMLAENFEVKPLVKTLNARSPGKKKTPLKKSTKKNQVESFDDFDYGDDDQSSYY